MCCKLLFDFISSFSKKDRSFGFDGGLSGRKSSGGLIIPRPISHDQIRLTILREKYGLLVAVSQSAKTILGSVSG